MGAIIIKVDFLNNNNMVGVIIQIKIRIETAIVAITTTITCNVVIVEEGEDMGAIIVAITTTKAINGNSLVVVAGAVVISNITNQIVKKVAVPVMVVTQLVASKLKILAKGSKRNAFLNALNSRAAKG